MDSWQSPSQSPSQPQPVAVEYASVANPQRTTWATAGYTS